MALKISQESFLISSENQYYFSEGPAIYNSDGELYYYSRPGSAKVLYIGERVTSISDEQLKEFSSLTEYQVDENNKIYSSRDGLLYKNSGKLLFNVKTGLFGVFTATLVYEHLLHYLVGFLLMLNKEYLKIMTKKLSHAFLDKLIIDSLFCLVCIGNHGGAVV